MKKDMPPGSLDDGLAKGMASESPANRPLQESHSLLYQVLQMPVEISLGNLFPDGLVVQQSINEVPPTFSKVLPNSTGETEIQSQLRFSPVTYSSGGTPEILIPDSSRVFFPRPDLDSKTGPRYADYRLTHIEAKNRSYGMDSETRDEVNVLIMAPEAPNSLQRIMMDFDTPDALQTGLGVRVHTHIQNDNTLLVVVDVSNMPAEKRNPIEHLLLQPSFDQVLFWDLKKDGQWIPGEKTPFSRSDKPGLRRFEFRGRLLQDIEPHSNQQLCVTISKSFGANPRALTRLVPYLRVRHPLTRE